MELGVAQFKPGPPGTSERVSPGYLWPSLDSGVVWLQTEEVVSRWRRKSERTETSRQFRPKRQRRGQASVAKAVGRSDGVWDQDHAPQHFQISGECSLFGRGGQPEVLQGWSYDWRKLNPEVFLMVYLCYFWASPFMGWEWDISSNYQFIFLEIFNGVSSTDDRSKKSGFYSLFSFLLVVKLEQWLLRVLHAGLKTRSPSQVFFISTQYACLVSTLTKISYPDTVIHCFI